MATLTFNRFTDVDFITASDRQPTKARPKTTRSALGNSIQFYRGRRLQLTRRRLADLVGLTEDQIADLEHGNKRAYSVVTFAHLQAIARHTNTTVTVLWKDVRTSIPYNDATTVAILIRRNADISLSEC